MNQENTGATAPAQLTFAVCTYDRSQRLPRLLRAMRAQRCPIAYEVLVVDNNSPDDTEAVVARIAAEPGVRVRYVRETEQGIPFARNRALAEAMDRDILVFIDDDELPGQGLLSAAVDAVTRNGAGCVGGRVKVDFSGLRRPHWLVDELLGFLAEVDYGPEPFWIRDTNTPIWTANVAYDMRLFREDATLRFDARYNRRGKGVGGGSDAVMFRELLARKVPMLYCPAMVVDHHVDAWRLKRSYFLKLHFVAGRKHAQFQTGDYDRTVFGVPPFMLSQALRHGLRSLGMAVGRRPGALRQGMNFTNALGLVWGRWLRWRDTALERAQHRTKG